MREPYVYADPDGDLLSIHPAAASGEVTLFATDTAVNGHVCVVVTAGRVAEIVTAMFDATGERPPLLVDDPDVTGIDNHPLRNGMVVGYTPTTAQSWIVSADGTLCFFDLQDAVEAGTWLIAYGRRAQAERCAAAEVNDLAVDLQDMTHAPADWEMRRELARDLLRAGYGRTNDRIGPELGDHEHAVTDADVSDVSAVAGVSDNKVLVQARNGLVVLDTVGQVALNAAQRQEFRRLFTDASTAADTCTTENAEEAVSGD